MTPEDWADVWRSFRCLATQISGPSLEETFWSVLDAGDAQWWLGSFDDPEPGSDDALELEAGISAVAENTEIPALTDRTKARLVLRLRLAAAAAMAMSNQVERPMTDIFDALRPRASHPERVRWLLVDSWEMWRQLSQTALMWALEDAAPKRDRRARRRHASSKPNSCSDHTGPVSPNTMG